MTTKRFDAPVYLSPPLLPARDAYADALAGVWEARWLTNNGSRHRLLEERLRDHLKVPGLSLFNNGTIALIVACQSLGLTGEVITTPFTFPATPHVLTWNGIKPVFCDIDPVTMNIDATLLDAMVTPRTSAILGVHVFGTPCDVDAIQRVADRHGLKVVYDAAHAFGVEIDGRGIGTCGDVSMFSFHATKLFHTAEGGALAFPDTGLKQQIDLLKNFGIRNEEEVLMPGINGKMNELQAALGLAVLGLVDGERERRQAVAAAYRAGLSGMAGLTLPVDTGPAVRPSMQYFVVRIDEDMFGCSRNDVYRVLREHNVMARKYFFPLCSEYSCYRDLPSADPRRLPVAHRVSKEVLALPFYGDLPMDHVDRICEIIRGCRSR